MRSLDNTALIKDHAERKLRGPMADKVTYDDPLDDQDDDQDDDYPWEEGEDLEVEAFRSGTHTDSNGHTETWSADKLKQIAENYNAAAALQPAPVCIGHPADNSPAYGWIKSASCDEGKLKLRLTELNPAFVSALKNGSYKTRSLSLYDDGTIRHLAFLGGAQPAIKGLAPFKFSDSKASITLNINERTHMSPVTDEVIQENKFFKKLFSAFKMEIPKDFMDKKEEAAQEKPGDKPGDKEPDNDADDESKAKAKEGDGKEGDGKAKEHDEFEAKVKDHEAKVKEHEAKVKSMSACMSKFEEAFAKYEDGKRAHEQALADYIDGKTRSYEDGKTAYEDGKKHWDHVKKAFSALCAPAADHAEAIEGGNGSGIPAKAPGVVHDEQVSRETTEKAPEDPKLLVGKKEQAKVKDEANEEARENEELTRLVAELTKRVADLEATLAAKALSTDNRAFCEQLVNEGRLRPADVEQTIENLNARAYTDSIRSFSEGQRPGLDLYREHLSKQARVVEFGETLPAKDAITAVPSIDDELNKYIEDKMKLNPNITYAEALKGALEHVQAKMPAAMAEYVKMQ